MDRPALKNNSWPTSRRARSIRSSSLQGRPADPIAGDFARIVDALDKAGGSFVSVTQAFNTTSSMGRLTLNVLLSFAQFEREVTANESATRSPHPRPRACGWGDCHPSATTRPIAASGSCASMTRRPRSSGRSSSATSLSGRSTRWYGTLPTEASSRRSALPVMARRRAASR